MADMPYAMGVRCQRCVKTSEEAAGQASEMASLFEPPREIVLVDEIVEMGRRQGLALPLS